MKERGGVVRAGNNEKTTRQRARRGAGEDKR